MFSSIDLRRNSFNIRQDYVGGLRAKLGKTHVNIQRNRATVGEGFAIRL
jgi:hypothetical protein